MKQCGLALVLITAANRREADDISSALLKNRKAACVNIVDGVASSYWWQGKIESSDEVLLMVKTRASAVSEVIELIKKNHSYSVPEIIALPILGGNQDYLEWVSNEVRE